MGAVLVVAALLASMVRIVDDAPRRTDPFRPWSMFADAVGTLATVVRLAGPRMVLLLTMAMTVIYGALGVLLVAVAVDHLAGGGRDVAVLSIALSAGLFGGGALAIGLVGRRMGWAIAAASVTLAVGLVGLGGARLLLVAVAATVLTGIALALLDVATRTLLQRTLDEDLMVGVFGLIESLWAFGGAAGAALGPILVASMGLGPALVVLAAVLPLLAIAARGAVGRLDDATTLPERQITLLTAIEMFAPLPRLEIERLSRLLDRIEVTAGATVIREGEVGDRFYIVDEGTFSVEAAGRPLTALGPADHFGEIALLRDVPRTATVVATSDGVLWALDRDEFLETLTGVPSAAHAAGEITDRRLRDLERKRS
jgi:MFS family permease